MAWRGCWGWTLGSVYSGCPICKGKQCFLAIMKFQPRELRVSVEIDDVPSLPNMYSRRTLPFFFLYQELFCDFNLGRVRKGRMRSGACLRLEFCLTGLPVLRGASCLSPPTHTPSVFYSHCFVLCVFICQTGRKNPSSFLPPFAGVSAALPPAISAFISLRVFLFFSFFFSRLRF